MAAPRRFLSGVFLLLFSACGGSGSGTPSSRRAGCGLKVQLGVDGGRRSFPVTFRADNCSSNYPLGKHVIHEVINVSFIHLHCEEQAAVTVSWSPSPLGIEHVKGFRVYLEDKNPEGKQCQHLILREPRQLNCSFKNTRLSSETFGGLTFDTDYMVRVVPFPTLMNESFFPPAFLRTNSCEVLLGSDNLVCKPYWKPKTLNVSQFGSNLHVTFDLAPASFGFYFYFLFYKLRQEGTFRQQRCGPDVNQHRTTCILQNVTPGTYTIELRDDRNTTRRQTQYHVSQVHSPWAGPIRAMAITVPLVIMSAFATLFTVMCRKKQQENIYSQLDEESSESSNQSAALGAERPWPRPKVFICYSNRDCSKHSSVVQSFAYFLQDFCCCEVILDLWEHLEICREGQMSWLSRQLDEANFIITVCSRGLRYYVEKKSRRGKTPVSRRGNSSSSSPIGGSGSDLFIVGVAMIAEKLRLAKQSEGGGASELNRYMTVYFDYSTENDIPTVLSLAPRLKLMDQLPQLFARLHSGLDRDRDLVRDRDRDPVRDREPVHVSRRNYFRSRSGRSLYVSICNMHQFISHNPDWFSSSSSSSSSLAPHTSSSAAPPPPPKPPCSSSSSSCSSSQPKQRLDSGLVLNEVLVNSPSLEGGEGAARSNVLLLAPGSGPGPDPCPSPGPGPEPRPGPGPRCSLSMLGPSSRSTCGRSGPEESCSSSCSSCSSSSSSSSAPSLLQEGACPVLTEEDEGPHSPPEAPPPRDSGIYDSSVPSSELSIPLMEGLSHDQADSASLADSQSSSSGLGDEDSPAVSSLRCSTVCKAELHHHGDAIATVASS